ncbi:MFS general substrate transporter [Trichoderma asperelloides]|nr:MFS general substrate transporter [Trichoderma asperelloides]
MRNYFSDVFPSDSRHALIPLCLLVYLHHFTDELISVPTNRLIEYAVCARYNRSQITTDYIPELDCKLEPVQKHVVYLLGWFYSIECLPSIITAIFWGYVADKLGRRHVLLLGLLGRVLSMLWMLAVGFWKETIPVELILFAPLLKFIGGGSRVFTSMIMSIASDATQKSQRTKLFFFMALVMDIANLTAPPAESATLAKDLWLPFQLSGGLFGLLLLNIWAIPESRNHGYTTNPAIDARGERENLLQDNTESLEQSSHMESRELERSTIFNRVFNLAKHQSVGVLLVVSLLKQTAFFSESFFVQYASERFKIVYSQAAWFNGVQATGAILALGLLLPTITRYLEHRLNSSLRADLIITKASLGSLVLAYSSVRWAWSIPSFAIGVFFCGVGEGAEPALQGFVSSLVAPSQHATLFTTMTLLESTGRIFGSPFMAFLLRVGRDGQGNPNGLIFLVAAALFLASFFCSQFVHVGKPDVGEQPREVSNTVEGS